MVDAAIEDVDPKVAEENPSIAILVGGLIYIRGRIIPVWHISYMSEIRPHSGQENEAEFDIEHGGKVTTFRFSFLDWVTPTRIPAYATCKTAMGVAKVFHRQINEALKQYWAKVG